MSIPPRKISTRMYENQKVLARSPAAAAARAVWKIRVRPMARGCVSIKKIVFVTIIKRTISEISENSLLK
jgi:hypothetical protein